MKMGADVRYTIIECLSYTKSIRNTNGMSTRSQHKRIAFVLLIALAFGTIMPASRYIPLRIATTLETETSCICQMCLGGIACCCLQVKTSGQKTTLQANCSASQDTALTKLVRLPIVLPTYLPSLPPTTLPLVMTPCPLTLSPQTADTLTPPPRLAYTA